MTEPVFMSASEVASEIFGFSEDWFRKVRQQLEAQGFPAPIRLPARAGEAARRGTEKWSRPYVMAWVMQHGPKALGDMAMQLAGAMPKEDFPTGHQADIHKLNRRL